MEQNFNREYWDQQSCPKVSCGKDSCKCGLKFVSIPTSLESAMSPENGRFCNAIVRYEGSGKVYIYSAEGIPVLVKESGDAS